MNEVLKESTKTKPKLPKKFEVLLLNDDYTTMDFVIKVLQTFFNISDEDSVQIMLKIHTEGEGGCGFFSFDIAQTKVTQVIEYARKNEQPLMCTLRKID
jgi:ATP-dependent Clp protease adaptor protein ClpS